MPKQQTKQWFSPVIIRQKFDRHKTMMSSVPVTPMFSVQGWYLRCTMGCYILGEVTAEKQAMRIFYFIGGLLALLLGVIGVFLPVLPTTPFMLLAAYCFARSSKRMYNWLVYQSLFGPLIRQWQQHRSIRPEIKRRAIFLVILSFSITLVFFIDTVYLQFLLLLIAVTLITFLYRIPSQSIADIPVEFDVALSKSSITDD